MVSMVESEALIPDEPMCPMLEAMVMEAKTCGEVCDIVKAHDEYCYQCKPGLRRAA